MQAGLDQIERKVNQILDKFVDMDTAKTLNQVNHTLVTLEQTLKNVSAVSANLDKFTGQSATQQLPASLNDSLKQLQSTLQEYDANSQTNQDLRQSVQSLNQLMRELQPLVHSLNEQPSSLIFDRARPVIPSPSEVNDEKQMMALALLGLLAGCSSAPTQLHYYSLDAEAQQAARWWLSRSTSWCSPVSLSGQLDRMSLVYQLEGKELHFAEYHRWAGSLDAQLDQLTLNGLSSRLPGWVVRQDGARKGPVLTISVERFQGRHDGRAVLSGWRLLTEEGTVLRDVPFQQVRVLPTDGYGTLVSELGAGWQQLLDQIAAEVRKSA